MDQQQLVVKIRTSTVSPVSTGMSICIRFPEVHIRDLRVRAHSDETLKKSVPGDSDQNLGTGKSGPSLCAGTDRSACRKKKSLQEADTYTWRLKIRSSGARRNPNSMI